MATKKDPIPEAFLTWLKEAADRFAAQTIWPKGATRFGYFNSELCWNLRPDLGNTSDQLSFSMEDYESAYKTAHESGDPDAIFEFAEDNREALMRTWVSSQLVSWRLSKSAKGKSQFDRFMQAYWNQQGTRSHKTMLGIIRRDQKVYRAFVQQIQNKSKKAVLFDLAEKYGMSQDNVKDVVKYYGSFYKSWKSSSATRIYLSLKT